MPNIFTKDPDAAKDYCWDFKPSTNGSDTTLADWLESGEIIVSHTVVVSPTGLTVDSSSLTDAATSVTAWLSGGTDRVDYTATCHIVTNSSPVHKENRSILIRVRTE